MQDWAKSRSLLLSQAFVLFFALLLAALDLGSFRIVRWFGRLRGLPEQNCAGILAILLLCSVFGWILLWAMWKLLRKLRQGQVFTQENVGLLHRVSWCCAVAAGLCAAGCFFYLPFLVAVAAAAFMSLIVRTVRNAFQTAVRMKDELDLTV